MSKLPKTSEKCNLYLLPKVILKFPTSYVIFLTIFVVRLPQKIPNLSGATYDEFFLTRKVGGVTSSKDSQVSHIMGYGIEQLKKIVFYFYEKVRRTW